MILMEQDIIQKVGDKLKLDYVENRGFKLITPEEILAFGLQIKRNKK